MFCAQCPVRLLSDFQIAQDAQRVGFGAGSQQTKRGFHQVARPDQMVSAQIFIALVESPGNRKAGDYASQKILGLVRAHHGHAGAIEIDFTAGLIEFQQAVLPILPMPDVVLAQFVVRLEQTGPRLLSGFGPDAAETQRQGELAVAGSQVDLAGKGDVSVFSAGVVPGHLVVLATGPAIHRRIRRSPRPSFAREQSRQRPGRRPLRWANSVGVPL